MFSRLSFIFIFLLISWKSYSQTVEVSGIVKDQAGEFLPGVTVILSGVTDSTFRSGTFTDADGRFFLNAPAGSYILYVSLIGFNKQQRAVEIRGEGPVSLTPFTLESSVYELKEAVVKGVKPAVRFEAGKTIVAPANSVLMAQSDAFNVLKNIPGVFATEEGGIRMNGQSGVNIQIDGREVYLSGAALINFLKSLPATSIETIEVVSNPGAAYDATGKAGTIIIHLKKNREESFALNAHANYQKSRNSRGDWGANIAYGRRKAGISLDYSGGVSDRLKQGVLFRKTSGNGEQQVKQRVALLNQDLLHNLRVLADFRISGKIQADVYASRGFYSRSIPGSSLSDFYSHFASPDSVLITESFSGYHQLTYAGGIRARFKNEKKQQLTLSAHGLSFSHKESLAMSAFSEHHKATVDRDTLSGNFGDQIKTVSFQGDWSSPLSEKIDFQAGVKQVLLDISNYAVYHKIQDHVAMPPSVESMHYEYNEAVGAAYVRLAGNYEKWSFSGGLRMENTGVRGNVLSIATHSDTSYSVNYTRWFPSANVNYKITAEQLMMISYSRYITRPNYRDLSPSGYIVDKYTMVTGNTALKPEFTHNLEWVYIPGGSLRTSVSYVVSNGTIGQLFRPRENGGLLITSQNMASRRTFGTRIDGSDLLTLKYWKLGGSVSLLYTENKWQESGGEKRTTRFTPLVNVSNSFVIGKGWAAELTAYRNGYLALGQIEIPLVWSVSCGVSKKMMDKSLTLRVFANDLFASVRERSIFTNGPVSGFTNLRYEETYIGVSLHYLFRKGKEKEANQSVISKDKRINF